jgi:hypothetical protein
VVGIVLKRLGESFFLVFFGCEMCWVQILDGVKIEIDILTGPRGAVDRETGRDRLDGYKKEQWRGKQMVRLCRG